MALLLQVVPLLASRAGTDCDEVASQQDQLLTASQRTDVKSRTSSLDAVLSSLTSFLVFVGYSRSGHTLVGALLDGHPQMIVANEYNALARPPTVELKRSLALNSAVCAVYGRTQAGFNYSLGGALWWQGRWCRPDAPQEWCAYGIPRILGDKRGGGTSQVLERVDDFPSGGVQRLLAFSRGLALPLRVLHILRNPFDMAATQFLTHSSEGDWHAAAQGAVAAAAKGGGSGGGLWHALQPCEEVHLARTAHFYVRLMHRNAELRDRVAKDWCACVFAGAPEDVASTAACLEQPKCQARPPQPSGKLHPGLPAPYPQSYPGIAWLDLKTESLQQTPRAHLELICSFLGVGCPESFLTAASSVVRPSRHETSALVRWPHELVHNVTASLKGTGVSAPVLQPLLAAYLTPPQHVAQQRIAEVEMTSRQPSQADLPGWPAVRFALTRRPPSCARAEPVGTAGGGAEPRGVVPRIEKAPAVQRVH